VVHLRPQQVQLGQELLLEGCAAKRRSLLRACALAARHRLRRLQHAQQPATCQELRRSCLPVQEAHALGLQQSDEAGWGTSNMPALKRSSTVSCGLSGTMKPASVAHTLQSIVGISKAIPSCRRACMVLVVGQGWRVDRTTTLRKEEGPHHSPAAAACCPACRSRAAAPRPLQCPGAPPCPQTPPCAEIPPMLKPNNVPKERCAPYSMYSAPS
jgi:hypothetical protein